LGEEDRRADVGRDDRVERCVVERGGRGGGEDAGVVDENVDASAKDLGGVVGELPDRAGEAAMSARMKSARPPESRISVTVAWPRSASRPMIAT
jgi:hypothetical protein